LRDKLVSAGAPHELTPDELIALKAVGMVMALMVFLPLPWGAFPIRLVLALATFFLPDVWLRDLINKRRQGMVRLLPGFIDLLTLAVEAGMDFMAALSQVVGMSMSNPLVDEFKLTLEEVSLGATREESLRKMTDRVRLPELTSFISSLLQANRLGTPLGRVLRIQAEVMRKKRIMRAEKLAQEASVKIILPLVAFIFPCVLIILLGPLLLKVLQGGF
jgi:tight adherence protein C